ncbi:MAG: TonB-dependent receptor, partial [Chitinophagaceae bacterium]
GLFFARSSLIFLLAGIFYGSSAWGRQSPVYSLRVQKGSLETAIGQLRQATGAVIAYNKADISTLQVSAATYTDLTAEQLLKKLVTGLPLTVQKEGSTYVLLKNTLPAREPKKDPGRVTGKIIDEETGDPVTGATILIGGKGVVTDTDGSFNISLPGGSYEAEISFVGYGRKMVTGIEVKEGSSFELNVTLKREKGQLAGVVVKSTARKESVASLYVRQKNNAAVSDGISAEQIRLTPDKNIGEVLKRINGLSTIDNKYVVVRGLSERYNQAVLNGQVMPSTELNRKNFSFDLIPANMVENVTVIKTLTPDRSAEFGGGLVEVNTLDIPASDFINISAGSSVNSNTTNKKFLHLQLGGSEYLGKAGSHRDLLGKLDWTNTRDVVTTYNDRGKDPRQFSNNWGLYEMNAQPSQNYQLAAGKTIQLSARNQLGLMLSVTYRNTLATQDVAMTRDGFTGGSPDKSERGFKGKRYGFTTNLGGMFGAGFRNEKLRVSYQGLYLRLYDQQLVLGKGYHEDPPAYLLGYYDLTTQTDLSQHQVNGEYTIGKKGVKLKWIGAYTLLDRNRPDNHQFKAAIIESGYLKTNDMNIAYPFSSGITAGALRWWNRALEKNYNWDVAVSVPFRLERGWFQSDHTFKAGYAGWSKDRLFYVMNIASKDYNTADYPTISQAFSPERAGQILVSQFADDFNKTANLHALYGMLDSKFGKRVRLVWGARAEYYNLNSINVLLDSLYSDFGTTLDYSDLKNKEPNWRFFPSANLTYSLTPKMNLRVAYAESIVRPDLRELSYFSEYDFELGGAYGSNLVRSTLVRHLDFRYEYYPGPGEVLSLSVFRKHFRYPMEIYKEGDNRSYKLKNNASATNLGLEIEVRKTLAFTKVPVIRNITLYGNFTALDGRVRENFSTTVTNAERTRVYTIDSAGREEKRPQTGASNYMVNAGIYYETKPFSLNLAYNYITNRTFRPSDQYQESLFERPVQSLDGQVSFRFLKQKAEVRVSISNLLNSYSLVYRNFYKDPAITGGKKDPSVKDLLYQKELDLIDYEAR